MSSKPWFSSYLWVLAPIASLGFLLWLNSARLHRVDYLANLVETDATVDPASATGYAGGVRAAILPEHNNESYQWIVQTQSMLAPGGEWRVRTVKYDNAPIGRTVLTPSPYRWWLGFVAEIDGVLMRHPPGLATERAARIADPLLHALLLVGAVAFAAWRFGAWPAGLLAVALATLFPFGGSFLPGQPGDGGLVLACLTAGTLLLLAGIVPRPGAAPVAIANAPGAVAHAPRWFFAAGVAGGLGLWVDVPRTAPTLVGIALAGLGAIWCARRAARSGPVPAAWPWRHWALGGTVTTLAAFLVEYSPAHLAGLHLQVVHPLHGIAWLGLGELLARLSAASQPGRSLRHWRTLLALTAAVLAIAAVPVVAFLTDARELLAADPAFLRLSNLAGSPTADSTWAWLAHDGAGLPFVAAALPLALLAAAAALLVWRGADWHSRTVLLVALGPVVVALAIACFRLREWNGLDAALLGLLVALTATTARVFRTLFVRWACAAGMAFVFLPGAILLANKALADKHDTLADSDVEALVERDLAHWLARLAGPGGAVVLAPPNLAASLIYHGGLSSIGSPYWENRDGFIAAMRIAGASTPDEAQALARSRNLGYIVIPSWDNFLEEYARAGASDPRHTLMALLQQWLPPRWLKPVPYHLPKIGGFEGQSVAIFQVIDVQDNATALSYLAEYFVEMGMTGPSLGVADTLLHTFPADLGAAVARALVARSVEDAASFEKAFADIQAGIERGDGENLSWDRRVSLAIALVDGRRIDQARTEAKRCLDEIDEPKLRSLTTVSLHRLLVLSRHFGFEIADPHLRALAPELLPAELRQSL